MGLLAILLTLVGGVIWLVALASAVLYAVLRRRRGVWAVAPILLAMSAGVVVVSDTPNKVMRFLDFEFNFDGRARVVAKAHSS